MRLGRSGGASGNGRRHHSPRVCDSNQTKRFDVNAVWFTSAVTKLTQHDLGLALISCHHLPTYFKNALCHVGLHWYDIGSPTGHLCHNHCLQSHIWNKLKAEDKAVSAIVNRRHLLATRYTAVRAPSTLACSHSCVAHDRNHACHRGACSRSHEPRVRPRCSTVTGELYALMFSSSYH